MGKLHLQQNEIEDFHRPRICLFKELFRKEKINYCRILNSCPSVLQKGDISLQLKSSELY